jgi:hypothetical protein
MKHKLLLCLALILSDGLFGCSAVAESLMNSNQWPGFQILPPITNANPSIRVPLLVHVPTKLKIERASDTLSVEIDKSSLEATNLMVGTNMVTGVESRIYVSPDGEPRSANGGYGLGGTDFNLGTSVWHTKREGIPLPGKKYVIELELTLFETDIPSQHEWSPYGKNYKILWQRTLKQTVLNTPTFLQNVLNKIEQQVPEYGSIGMTTGIRSSGQVWHGEEYASGGFFLRQYPRYHPAGEFPRETKPVLFGDISVTIARYVSSGDAQKNLEMSLSLRQAAPPPKGIIYKGATLYRYLDSTGKTATVVCQSGLYIVEINPNSEGARPLTMKVLDVVLAELDSTRSKSK